MKLKAIEIAQKCPFAPARWTNMSTYGLPETLIAVGGLIRRFCVRAGRFCHKVVHIFQFETLCITIRDSCAGVSLSLACTYAESFYPSLSVAAGAFGPCFKPPLQKKGDAEAFADGRNAR